MFSWRTETWCFVVKTFPVVCAVLPGPVAQPPSARGREEGGCRESPRPPRGDDPRGGQGAPTQSRRRGGHEADPALPLTFVLPFTVFAPHWPRFHGEAAAPSMVRLPPMVGAADHVGRPR